MKRLPLALTLLTALLGCTLDTKVTLEVDLLSLMASPLELPGLWLPTTTTGFVALIPRIQVTDSSIELIEDRSGVVVSIPDVAAPDATAEGAADSAGVTAALRIEIHLDCRADGGALPGPDLTIFVASLETTDVYSDGIRAATISVPSLPPGNAGNALVSATFDTGSGILDLFDDHRIRVGALLEVPPGTGEPCHIDVRVSAILLTVSGYPYHALVGLLP